MPKASKRKGKHPGTHDDGPKPYDRVDNVLQAVRSHSQPESSKQAANNHSPQHSPVKIASQPLPELSRSQRRKEAKRRLLLNGAQPTVPAAVGANGAHCSASSANGSHPHNVPTPGSSSGSVGIPVDSTGSQEAEAVRQRMFPSSAHKYEKEAKELRRKVASMTKAEEDAAAITAQLQNRIEELEKTVAAQNESAERTQAEIEVKTKVSTPTSRRMTHP